MKRLIAGLLCLICLFAVAGCAAKPTALHNVSWDMTQEEVIAAEGEKNIVAGSTDRVLNWMLTDELADIFGERTVSVGYVFSEDEGKLISITVQIFINDGETIADAMTATRAVMDKVYGESTGDDSGAHWHGETSAIALQAVEGAQTFFVALYSPISAHSH